MTFNIRSKLLSACKCQIIMIKILKEFYYAQRTSNEKLKTLYDGKKGGKMPPKLGSLGNGVFQWKEEGYRSFNDDTKMWESQSRSTTSLKELPAQRELNLERFR